MSWPWSSGRGRASVSAARGFSRRAFVVGTAAGAAVTAASLSACTGTTTSGSKEITGEPQASVDDSSIVSVTSEYEYVDDTGLTNSNTWSIDLGTTLFHNEGSWAAALLAPETALIVNTVGVLSLTTGELTTLVSEPVMGTSYSFYDVRCGTGAFAWVELNLATRDWAFFAQAFSSGSLSGSAMQLDSGDEDWSPPMFTVSGSSVFWQHMPNASGSASSEYSHLYRWNTGDDESTEIYESPGRFATTPRVSNNILTISPRVHEDEGTYYGMTALDLTDDSYTLVDQLVMPKKVKPFEAVYMDDAFVFSVEANYSSGGSLGNMGTYIGREGGPYIYLSREPYCCVAGKDSKYLVKVLSSHYVVDTEAQTYSVLTAPDKSLEHGDYPASAGMVNTFVSYSTIKDSEGVPQSVTVRTFSL